MSDELLAGIKAVQRAIWTAGDYDVIAGFVWDVGRVVAEAAKVEPQMDVLDVATGTGNAAIRAAEAGGNVVGLDLTPELFDAARRRAQEASVRVDWVEGDAEALPFGDESFDRVLSTFGVMFAPRHEVAAAELVRVCRGGGQIVLANWTPEGFVGSMFRTIIGHLPPMPTAGPPPIFWGLEAHVRTLLGGQVLLAIERRTVEFTPPTVDDMIELYEASFGPLVLAKQMLPPEGYDALRADLRALIDQFNAGDGEPRIPGEYLLVVGLKP